MYDPVGPGTPAWDAFDKAVDAFLRTPGGSHNQGHAAYRQYKNYRDYMIAQLRANRVPDVRPWTDCLRDRCREEASARG